MTNAQAVFQALSSDTLTFNKRDKTQGKMANVFKFESEEIVK
jgi:hypothetical protein